MKLLHKAEGSVLTWCNHHFNRVVEEVRETYHAGAKARGRRALVLPHANRRHRGDSLTGRNFTEVYDADRSRLTPAHRAHLSGRARQMSHACRYLTQVYVPNICLFSV